MIESEQGLIFESTGREVNLYGYNTLNIFKDQPSPHCITSGYDNTVDIRGMSFYEQLEWDFTDEEKKEMAEYMIRIWAEYGKLNLKI